MLNKIKMGLDINLPVSKEPILQIGSTPPPNIPTLNGPLSSDLNNTLATVITSFPSIEMIIFIEFFRRVLPTIPVGDFDTYMVSFLDGVFDGIGRAIRLGAEINELELFMSIMSGPLMVMCSHYDMDLVYERYLFLLNDVGLHYGNRLMGRGIEVIHFNEVKLTIRLFDVSQKGVQVLI